MPLLLIAILTAGCKQKEDKKDSDIVAISEAVAEVDTLSLRRQTFQKQLLCNGNLQAVKIVELTLPKAGGNIEGIYVHNGQKVAAGQLIAEADV